MLRPALALTLALMFPTEAQACETALLLTIDVSSSIDVGEYRIQTDGMADALLDPEIAEALVAGQSAVAVMQWSGVGEQRMVIPWARMQDPADVVALALAARNMRRVFINSDTAIGDAIRYAASQFGPVADCTAQVIDISGDGAENAGSSTPAASRSAAQAGITINGIAIESLGIAITRFYQTAVITRHGFVVTARGHLGYPRAIREKIRRELAKVSG